MARDISQVVRELMQSLPETEEFVSHGSPTFRVRGKTFATYNINHHGDGRVALSLDAPPGAQQLYTEMEPEYYFVPPYTGPRGWLGIDLDKGLSWTAIGARVREAYEKAAPASLTETLGEAIDIAPPTRAFRPEEINPYLGKRALQVLGKIDVLCRSLPETEPSTQFGSPVWKAGKKTFVSPHYRGGRLQLSFWVGSEQQDALTFDERYRVPAYTGHNGWIELDVEEQADWEEIEHLLLQSYRHFALKRMLKALDG